MSKAKKTSTTKSKIKIEENTDTTWSKWLKPSKIENLEIVKSYFGFGIEKAKDALEVLSDTQIEKIKAQFTEGGVEKK